MGVKISMLSLLGSGLKTNNNIQCEVSGSHGGEYED
jgi:hypothetical protein